MTSGSQDPIAIIGMACRWPGDSESPSEMWDFLEAGRDAYGEFPPDRIATDSFYHPTKNRPGSFYTRGGCFLKSSPRKFDPSFFGIGKREAMTMDPAQRKFMEVVYESVESAGVPLEKFSGSLTGTFVGNFNYDHQLMGYRDAEYPEPYSVTGGGITILSNRVNYVFDLKGPSMTLDTACSSSMYALHLACLAINAGDCDAAIVGGSNLILTPECQIFSSLLGAVSPTSRCHTFDALADGYARADGIGALYVKRLSAALRDNDPIRAVVRATAFNANGRTGGITHPSPDGQEAVIRQAYHRARLDPALTTYFECHGTGTPVGDPLEIAAIGRVFGSSKSDSAPLLIGSVKSNMGHSEPVSGIAGVMKTVLGLERGIIPPTIGVENINPNIDLQQGKIKIVTESTKWPFAAVRRASVNSFGYGGSNAHCILESAESFLPGYSTIKTIDGPAPSQTSKKPYLLCFSAHNEQTLKANMASYKSVGPKYDIVNLAYTLGERRSKLLYRSFAVARPESWEDDLDEENSSVFKHRNEPCSRLGFIFTGQGAQWPRMGLDLYESYHVFKMSINRMDHYLSTVEEPPQWKIIDILLASKEESRVYQAEIAQPMLTAIQVALVDLLASWNIKPNAVVGHSSGEIGAAYAAGIVTAKHAIVAAYLRGVAVSRNTKKGAMLAVGAGEERITPYLKPFGEQLVIACHNSPESLTISGDSNAIQELKNTLDEEKIFARVLATDGRAYHSHHMRDLGRLYEEDMNAAFGMMEGETKGLMIDDNSTSPSPCREATPESHLHRNGSPTTNGQQNGNSEKLTTGTLHPEGNRPRKPALQRFNSYTRLPIKFISSVFARPIDQSEITPSYWRANLESPVLFRQAVEELIETTDLDAVIEIGPHTALQGPLRQIAQALPSDTKLPEYMSSLVRNSSGARDLLRTAGFLFQRDYPVNLSAINGAESDLGKEGSQRQILLDLPRYQWQYTEEAHEFIENRWTKEWRLRKHPRHDILGTRQPGGLKDEPIWRNILRVKDVPWLADHKLGSEIVFPAAGFLSMALEAATQSVEVAGFSLDKVCKWELSDVVLKAALLIPEEDGIEVLLSLRNHMLNQSSRLATSYDFTITSVVAYGDETSFIEHASGRVNVQFEETDTAAPELASHFGQKDNLRDISATEWYSHFANVGLEYGNTFQGLSEMKGYLNTNIVQSTIGLHPSDGQMDGESRYLVHPATLDAALQLCIVAGHGGTATKLKSGFMPVQFEKISVFHPVLDYDQNRAATLSKAEFRGVRALSADLVQIDDMGRTILDARGLLFFTSDQSMNSSSDKTNPYARMVWTPDLDFISTTKVEQMFPPVVQDETSVVQSLNRLALHQIVEFHRSHPEIFKAGSKEPHLNRLLQWMSERIDLFKADKANSDVQNILSLSSPQLQQDVARLSDALKERSSEARLMCRIYENLPAIFAGDKSGIQVALEDNLLIENYELGQVYREGNRRLADMVSILSYQQPNLKIIEAGAGTGSATNEILRRLKGDSLFRRYKEYVFSDISPSFLGPAEERFKDYQGLTFKTFDMDIAGADQGLDSDYDLFMAANVVHVTSNISKTLRNIRQLLKPGGRLMLLELTECQLNEGIILGTFSDFWKGDLDPDYPRRNGPFLSKSMWKQVLAETGFGGVDFFLDDYHGDNRSTTVICATAVDPQPVQPAASIKPNFTIVYRNMSGTVQRFCQSMTDSGYDYQLVPLTSTEDIESNRCIFLAEMDEPLFLNITNEEWQGLQKLMTRADTGLWVTTGNLMRANNPLYAMMSGIARGLRTEMPQLNLGLLDIDSIDFFNKKENFDLLMTIEGRLSSQEHRGRDTEYRMHDGILHLSRLQPDDDMNKMYEEHLQKNGSDTPITLSALKVRPFKLAIEKPGVFSTIFFEDDETFAVPLDPEDVEIEVAAAGLNNKDIAVLAGKFHVDSTSDECAGTIVKVGSAVQNFAVGDHVIALRFAKFGNFVRSRAMFCQKITPKDPLKAMATMPIAFATAIYGLLDLGALEKGQSVLIQSATGGVGLAAIQIAQTVGAEIYATVGTEEKKQALLKLGLGIREDRIFSSRTKAGLTQLQEASAGRGIDVILCSARGELMHEYWKELLAPLGRFIEIGRTEVLEGGKLDLSGFLNNTLFASFDLESISREQPQIIRSLMERVVGYYRIGCIRPLPSTEFHISEIGKAMSHFVKGVHIGKIVIDYEHSDAGIPFREQPFEQRFDPNAAYLLVGALGGLGRAYSKWMVTQGARNLIYLSRSGARGIEATDFVNQLRRQGVLVSIQTGNVAVFEDVQKAVASSQLPIKGVLHSALSLNDALFERMSLEQFQRTLLPRVLGTIHLHRALSDINAPLDFFVLWSSWTTLFGTATQSNYLASNAFMDAFARHRRSLGLPATSLDLSQIAGVGIISHMPEYQASMLRYGFYGSDEDAFLQFAEAATISERGDIFEFDQLSNAQLLAGLEPAGLRDLDEKHPIRDMVWYNDPRFSNLVQATEFLSSTTEGAGPEKDGEGSSPEEQIRNKIARLLYLPADEIAPNRQISEYGIDSMVAAELRNWLFARFNVKISMLNLLGAGMSVSRLAGMMGDTEVNGS